ncbi:LLM class flavin-dependent oxidoreductase [Microbacter sp. GSS18]|nr:LLM class flavin-dependent oxidoreductase [Microbacter sp. GSS18]
MALKFWATAPFFYGDMDRPWTGVLSDMLDLAQAAEDLGFEGLSMPENHFQNYVTNPSSLTFSAVVAARTKRLKLQPGVIVLPYYHPLLIASEIGLLDGLAPGRVDIGIARGGSRPQFDRIGVPYDEVRAIYEESLDIMLRAWTEDDLTYDGKYYQFPATTLVPKPTTKPHPALWVAAQSVEGVRKVAEDGLNLLTMPNYGNFEPHGDLELLLQTYNDAVATSGKPRGGVMVMRHVWLGQTEDQAKQYFDRMVDHWNHYLAFVKNSGPTGTAEGRLTRRVDDKGRNFVTGGKIHAESNSPSPDDLYENYNDPIMTTPDRMIERVKSYEALGVNRLSVHQAWGQPIGEVIKNMEFMAQEVFPAFAEEPQPAPV